MDTMRHRSSWIQCDTGVWHTQPKAESVTAVLPWKNSKKPYVRVMPVQIFFDCTEREDGQLRSTDQGASLAVHCWRCSCTIMTSRATAQSVTREPVSRVELGASVEPECTVGPIDRGIRRPRIAASAARTRARARCQWHGPWQLKREG